jgi:hypothetical protein
VTTVRKELAQVAGFRTDVSQLKKFKDLYLEYYLITLTFVLETTSFRLYSTNTSHMGQIRTKSILLMFGMTLLLR